MEPTERLLRQRLAQVRKELESVRMLMEEEKHIQAILDLWEERNENKQASLFAEVESPTDSATEKGQPSYSPTRKGKSISGTIVAVAIELSQKRGKSVRASDVVQELVKRGIELPEGWMKSNRVGGVLLQYSKSRKQRIRKTGKGLFKAVD